MKYRASGTVYQTAWYGLKVIWSGIQRKVLVTSCSGFTELLIITYTGTSANNASRVSTIRRVHRKDGGGAIRLPRLDIAVSPPRRNQQVDSRHHQQEQQHQHGHGRAFAEVPGHERGLVDVDLDHVGRARRGRAEQHERRGEVVERPQEQHQHQHLVDRAQRRHGDLPDLLPDAGPVDGRGLVQVGRDALQSGHHAQERERPVTPDRDDDQREEAVVPDQPERRLAGDAQRVVQQLVHQAVVVLEHERPDNDRGVDRQRERGQEDRAEHGPAAERVLGQDRRHRAEQPGQADRQHGEGAGYPERVQQGAADRLVEVDREVVILPSGPGRSGPVADEEQGQLLEADHYPEDHRDEVDEQFEDQRGQQEQVGQAALADPLPPAG